jgi:uncharacterized protein YwgA
MHIRQIDYLASVIANCHDQQVIGRTKLQKIIYLLQECGLPSNYSYSMYFYGPYSEDVKADLAVLKYSHIIDETLASKKGEEGEYYVLKVIDKEFEPIDLSNWRDAIEEMDNTDSVILELAATYVEFRDSGYDEKEAEERVRRMKGLKCGHGNLKAALDLIQNLGLNR